MRKIVVFTGNRAEYGLLAPVIEELTADDSFQVDLVVSGSHLSGDYGATASQIDIAGLGEYVTIDLGDMIRADRIQQLPAFARLVEASADTFRRLAPDLVLIAGDRFETFAVAVAAFYSNRPLAQLFAGDLSQGGHLDDSVRHAITKLAHLHFTTNEDSHRRVLALGEEPWRVHQVGSPVVDTIVRGRFATPEEISAALPLDLTRPFVIFTMHPITTQPHLAYDQAKEALEALKQSGLQTIVTYPCNDPGSDRIIRAIEEYEGESGFVVRKSLGSYLYLGCLRLAACVVGNSSSGLLETPIFKVPCVNVGHRQDGRLRSSNVIDVDCDRDRIRSAIDRALNDRDFHEVVRQCLNPYGTGGSAEMVADVLKQVPLDGTLLRKKMTY